MSRQASKRRRHQQHACTRKSRYATEREAMAASALWNLTYYRCLSCRGWHLTKGAA